MLCKAAIYYMYIHLQSHCVCACVCVTGPDICGPGTKKVHVILRYKGENKLIKKDIRCKVINLFTLFEYSFIHPLSLCPPPPSSTHTYTLTKDDEFTHLYTLILRSDNTYEVKIDNKKAEGGSLEEDWDLLAPKTIPDPDAKKPEDWDDRPKIDDPEDSMPEVCMCSKLGRLVACTLW